MEMSMAEKSLFSVEWLELQLNQGHIERGMGYVAGSAPEPVRQVVAAVIPEAPAHARIQAGYVLIPSERCAVGVDQVRCDSVVFATGTLIAKQLRAAEALALFVATAGPGLEKWSKELMAEGEFVNGFVVDTLGSETAELAAEWLMQKLADVVSSRHWGLTNRFSPGYCGWSVAEQHKLFSLLPPGFCDIVLTPTALMVPIKSVSGIVGLGNCCRPEGYVCSLCEREDCFKRRLQ